MIRRSAFVAIARLLSAIFFLATSLYCLLTYNAFAYQQFIRPHLISALTSFTVWHALLYWLVLLMTTLTLLPAASRREVRRAVWIYVGGSAAIGVWLLSANVLPQVENSRRSLVLALIALVPPIWLAWVDHRVAAAAPREPSDNGRMLTSALLAALATWLIYASMSPFRPRPSGVIAISIGQLAMGASSSAVAHLTAFTVLVLTGLVIREIAVASRLGPRGEYRLLVCGSAVAVTLVVERLIFAPISFLGPGAWAVAALAGTMAALTWSSIARYRHADAPSPRPTAMDLWLAPISSSGSRAAPVAGLLLLPVAAYATTQRAAVFDWNFMVQQLIALAVWVAAFAFIHAIGRGGAAAGIRGGRHVAVPLVVLALYGAEAFAIPRMSGWLKSPRLQPEFVLDAYAASDPSYRLIREALTTDPGADPEFYAYLRAHSAIHPSVPVEPASIDFVSPLDPAPGARPHIFFFILDSLRPDYVSAYNPAVTFTPELGAFAREPGTYVFTRAFARYGGTGLSVPSIWAGAMLLHKEYVTPFAPMNALEKLLQRNGYEWFVTKDHITDLLTPSPAIQWLDRDVPEMEHSFCGTMRELDAVLRARGAGAPPIFAQTRPLDLHVSKVRSAPPPGESYPGFSEAYAARVRRMDACFGEFVDGLKAIGLYDDSVIVLVSDHGDSLGDEQRWGHAYTLYPEVLRIPLLVHLPPALAGRVAADLSRVSFASDITPTLYALLGYQPAARGPLYGAPLVDRPEADWSDRRRDAMLVASSYGAVYGLLSQNGRKLYIADAINEREYACEIAHAALGTRVGVSDVDRLRYRRLIRDQVGQLAAQYRFSPQP